MACDDVDAEKGAKISCNDCVSSYLVTGCDMTITLLKNSCFFEEKSHAE